MTNKYTILTTVAIALVAIAGSTAAIIGSTDNVLATDVPATTTYNPDMTDWWGDMIEHLGDESSANWTEPGWSDDLYVQIESTGEGTYRISLFGIAESGEPITYTITETENGYDKYGPELEDGTMDSRAYVTAAPSAEGEDALMSQPIKPSHLIIRDARTGQGPLDDQARLCFTAPFSWLQGDVTDDWDGSLMNYRATNDAWDNCSKPLSPEDTDLAWRNGSYELLATGTSTFGSVYFYTPDPDVRGESFFDHLVRSASGDG